MAAVVVGSRHSARRHTGCCGSPQLFHALGFVDAFRKFDERGGQYSWWDYRAGGFRKNEGLRIDYAFLSPGLGARAKSCRMDVEPRHKDKPSDHIPVVVELE